MVGSNNFETKDLARSIIVANGKTNISPRYISDVELGKAAFGWQTFRVQKHELKAVSLSAIIPDCDTSPNSQNPVPTSTEKK